MKIFALILIITGILFLEPRLAQERLALNFEERHQVSTAEFFLQFLGEFRYSLASYLWLNTEIYHHELNLGTSAGLIGREDPKKVGEIIEICRIVIRLDPHFVQAYSIASWHLGKGLGKFSDSLKLLYEGLKLNPQSDVLNDDLATTYFFYLKDYKQAAPYARKAANLTRDSQQKILDLRILAESYEKIGEIKEAIEVYHEILTYIPNDFVAQKRLKYLQKAVKLHF